MRYPEADVTPPPTAQHVFIARQPIFDTHRRRVAYELLYRAHRDATQAIGLSESHMCGDTALHALLSIGLGRLTAGATAFVNITREQLRGELYKILDPTVWSWNCWKRWTAMRRWSRRPSAAIRRELKFRVVSDSRPPTPYPLLRRYCATLFAMFARIESALNCAIVDASAAPSGTTLNGSRIEMRRFAAESGSFTMRGLVAA